MSKNLNHNSLLAQMDVTAVILEDHTIEAENLTNALKESINRISGLNTQKLNLVQPQIKKTKGELYGLMEKDEYVPDWIFCDVDLEEKKAGFEVAKTILRRGYPTDVLLYTQGGIFPEDEEIRGNRYCNIVTANRAQIEGSIDRLIWRAVTRFPDPEYLRGILLSRAADTEAYLDDCLTQLYGINKIQEELRDSFKWGLLRSEGYGPSTKFKVLKEFLEFYFPETSAESSTITKKDLKNIAAMLETIFKTRNIAAHGIGYPDGNGGLFLTNRMKKRDGSENGKNYEKPITRADIKSHLYRCYTVENELSKLLDYLTNKKGKWE